MCLPWYLAVLGVNTPFKFAVFVREGAAPLPCIKGDRDSDRPWGQISQNQSKNDKKGKIVQRSQLCDHLVGRRDTMNAESNEMLPVSEKYMLTIKEAGHYYNRAMGGSFSIKSVLPAIFPNDPELNYHNLEGVHNGSEAMTIFPRIKDMPAEEQKKARHNLLKYCELDTYAMVKVWGELVRVVKGDTEDGD